MLCLGSFPGLIRGRTVAFFQICDMVFVLIEVLIVFVRSVVAIGPRCLRCIMDIWSGPTAGEFFACLIAAVMSLLLNIVVCVACIFLIVRVVILASLSGCFCWKLISSLLSAWAIFACLCSDLLFWNVMDVFLNDWMFFCLLSMALIVFQSVLLFVL